MYLTIIMKSQLKLFLNKLFAMVLDASSQFHFLIFLIDSELDNYIQYLNSLIKNEKEFLFMSLDLNEIKCF